MDLFRAIFEGSDSSESDSETNDVQESDMSRKLPIPQTSASSDVNAQSLDTKQQAQPHSVVHHNDQWDEEKEAGPSMRISNEIRISTRRTIDRQRRDPQGKTDTLPSADIRRNLASRNIGRKSSKEQVPDHRGMSSSELESLLKVIKDDRQGKLKKSKKKKDRKEKKRKKQKKQKKDKDKKARDKDMSESSSDPL